MDTQETSLIPESALSLLNQATEYWKSVKEINVKTQKEFDSALGVCKTLKEKINELENTRKVIVGQWDSKVRLVNKNFKVVRDSLENGESAIKRAMGVWQRQEMLRIEEENRKLAAIAAEKARKEQEKAEAEIRKAEEYRALGKNALADKAEARADTAFERSALIVPEIKTLDTKGKGASFTEYYEGRVTCLKAFLSHCLDSPSNTHLLGHVLVDTKAIDKIQNAMKGALVIPGIEFEKKIRASVRL